MNRRVRRFFLSSGILFCISVCVAGFMILAEEKVLSHDSERDKDQEAYWQELENFNLGLMQNTALPADFRKFAAGLTAVTRGDMDKAVKAFEELLASSEDARIHDHARIILQSLRFFLAHWKAILESEADDMAGKGDGNRKLVQAFNSLERETYHFPDESCIIPCEWSSTGSPIVDVLVNGQRKKFWIDTGAGLSAVSSDVAEACNVKPVGDAKGEAGTATSRRISVQPAVIRELNIGGIVVANHPVIIIDKKDLELKVLGIFRILKIEGLIGWNAIRHMDIEIDYRENTTTIREPRRAGAAERNLFWLGYPIVSLTDLSGVKLHFGLDTGARRTSISENFLTKVKVDNIQVKKKTIGSAGGFEHIISAVVPDLTLRIGENTVKLHKIGTYPQMGAVFIKLDGTLGCDVWRNRRIRIDWTNGIFDLRDSSQ